MISVVIPAFNAAATLAETIDSVLAQTHRNLEILVVDNGSWDRTGAIAKEYAARDRRCRCLRQAAPGAANARNRGIDEARGTFLAFVDADDLYAPTKLERQLAVLRRAAGDTVVLCRIIRFVEDDDGQKTFRTVTAVPELPAGDCLSTIVGFEGNQMALFTTGLIPRDCLLRAGKFDPLLPSAEDWDLGLRLAVFCSFAAVQEPLYLYRKHAASVTATQNLDRTLHIHLDILRRAAARSSIPGRLLRQAERKQYIEMIRALMYYRDFGAAWRMLLAGCREKSLFRDRRFPGLCVEIATGKLGRGE
ncbi:MAG: glycosyltransferase [Desulfuromonadales bacterium]